MDPLFGAGLWTTGVHGHLFLNNEKWTKREIVQKKDLKNNNNQLLEWSVIISKTRSMDTFFHYRKVLDSVHGHFLIMRNEQKQK